MLGGRVAGLLALTACGRMGFDERAIPADVQVADVQVACAPLACAGAAAFTSCNGTCFATCDEAVTQPAAAQRCTQWGGTLATIRDADDQACVQALITNDVWLGYEQAATATQPELGWGWADGSPSTYTNWRVDEPNDLDLIEDGEENCLLMFFSGTWNDYACGVVFPTIACSR